MHKLILASAAALLLGVGCIPDIDLNRKVTDVNPFGEVSRAERLAETRSIGFTDGLTLVVRPTSLGVTGTVADVLGDENGRMEATLDLSDGAVLDWIRTDRRETDASVSARTAHVSEGREGTPPTRVYGMATTEGRLAFERGEDDRRMLLPAFWPEGEADVGASGVLWLPKDAHARLKQGQRIEWNLGLGNPAVDAASDVLKAFDATARHLFGGERGGSPFDLELVTEDGLFAVRIDGKVRTVEVLQAKSWFANYLILDHPDNPLILKVGVNPVAAGALDAFTPLGVDARTLGYEITEIIR